MYYVSMAIAKISDIDNSREGGLIGFVVSEGLVYS